MSTAKFDTLQNADGSKSVPVSTVVDGSAKAWVYFNGTGIIAILGSHNVSSISDTATGSYYINFTTALSNATYATAFGSSKGSTAYSGVDFQLGNISNAGTRSTTGFAITATDDFPGLKDNFDISVIVLA